jgi:Tol biopolymer transport system component/DNA-binding winged helix-turn-helix (wHTH) protein
MEQATVSPKVYRFGPFELSRDAAELRKSGVRLKLPDQPFQILCTLLDHPGELVTREQLQQQLWPDGTFVDFEHGLNTAVKRLRDVLSDDADTPRYIETLPRRGYRFIGTLQGESSSGTRSASFVSEPRPKLRFALGIAAIAIFAFAVLFAYRDLSQPLAPLVTATSQLTFTGDLARFSAQAQLQTDGRRVFYTRASQNRVFSVPVHGGAEASFATTMREPLLLHISPDGSILLAREAISGSGDNEGQVWLLPTNGSPARRLGNVEASSAAWSPAGRNIVFSKGGTVYLTDPEGSADQKIFDLPGIVEWVRWAPDGRRLRVGVVDRNETHAGTWEIRLDQPSQPRSLSFPVSRVLRFGDWTRNGRYFFFRNDHADRSEYWYVDESRFSLKKRIPAPLSSFGFNVVAAAASPLENRIFVLGQQFSTSLNKFDPRTGKVTPFLPEFNGKNATFSPDGKWMLVAQHRNYHSVLWRARSDGSEWLQLTSPGLYVSYGRYSPDGKRVAVMSRLNDGPRKIYLTSADGGSLQEMQVPVENPQDPNWTPDGQSIIFSQPPRYFTEPESLRAIYTYNLQTKAFAKLLGTDGWFSPRISPDGRQLLALTIDEHKLGLYDLLSQQWRTLAEEPQHRVGNPFWSPDGKWAYVNLYDCGRLLRIRLADNSREDVLTCREAVGKPDCYCSAFAPDGSIMVTTYHYDTNLYSLEYE